MNLHPVEFSGARKGIVYFNRPLWERLPNNEQNKLIGLLANNTANHWGRNVYQVLESPVMTENWEIAALRLKGSCPAVPLRQHSGEGFVPYPLEVSRDGFIQPFPTEGGQPEGGAIAESAENEFMVAARLGPKITDHAVGYGIFPDLEFRKEKMGFSILGQEAEKDLRMRKDQILPHDAAARLWPRMKVEGLLDLELLAGSLGNAFSAFHKQYFHGYPHFNNIGIIPPQESNGRKTEARVIIRDLESCSPLWEANQRQRFGYLGIDLLKILAGLWEVKNHCEGMEYPVGDPLGAFMRNYFGELPPRAALEGPKFNHFFITVNVLIGQGTATFNMENFLSKNPAAFAKFLYERIGHLSSPSSHKGQRLFPFI